MTAPTQVKHPWRSTARTAFQFVIGAAPLAPVIYHAATSHDPGAATGLAATALAISAGVARVMALPQVDAFLQRFAPFLAAAPRK